MEKRRASLAEAARLTVLDGMDLEKSSPAKV
jgi:hypothetical protein